MKYILIFITAFYITVVHADIVMGVVPQQSPLKLLKVWSPIAHYLSEQTGEKIIFKTEKSINEFEKVLYSGGYDFAYMNPYHFIVANKLQGYNAKLRAKKNIVGILVRKQKTSLKKLNNKNNIFLFPAPNAFAATLLTKYELIQKYGVSIETLNKAKYVNSHDSVYKGISRGMGDVGGGIERTYKNLHDERTKNSLKIIHKTKAYPSHPFAFNTNISQMLQKKIIDSLINIPKHYLQALNIKSLKKIDNNEYRTVKKLAVKLKIMPKEK